ncbi:hypothetical protein SHXM_06628 [Streptomyces hygroscopicus]|nr:hypothetical protein SHXM_06628 [Streptomyces hygroscopicus]
MGKREPSGTSLARQALSSALSRKNTPDFKCCYRTWSDPFPSRVIGEAQAFHIRRRRPPRVAGPGRRWPPGGADCRGSRTLPVRDRLYRAGHGDPPLPHRRPPARPRRSAPTPGTHPLAGTAPRRRLVRRGLARPRPRAGRVLGHRVRLAGAGGAAERVPPVHDGDRRAAGALPPYPLTRAGCPAAADHPWLAGFGRGVHRGHRPADRSARTRGRPGRRLPRRHPVPPRLRLLRPAPRTRLGRPPHRHRVDGADAAPGVRALRHAGWRLRFADLPPRWPGWRRPGSSAYTSTRW